MRSSISWQKEFTSHQQIIQIAYRNIRIRKMNSRRFHLALKGQLKLNPYYIHNLVKRFVGSFVQDRSGFIYRTITSSNIILGNPFKTYFTSKTSQINFRFMRVQNVGKRKYSREASQIRFNRMNVPIHNDCFLKLREINSL